MSVVFADLGITSGMGQYSFAVGLAVGSAACM